MKSFKIQLHIINDAGPNSGGGGVAAVQYAKSVARHGFKVVFVSKYISDEYLCHEENEDFIYISLSVKNNMSTLGLVTQYIELDEICRSWKIELIHIHGVWSPLLALAAYYAVKNDINYVVSPHGSYNPWALKYKKIRKAIALKTYQAYVNRHCEMFISASPLETDAIRALGYLQPVAEISLGVNLTHINRGAIAEKKVKTLLYLSRLHPSKGIELLLDSWSRLDKPDWRLLIVGEGDEKYESKLRQLVTSQGLTERVYFTGKAAGAVKQKLFEEADLFVLPTFSENFGLVVAEALMNEVPVITTTAAPWRSIIDHHCGWWVAPNVDEMTRALSDATNISSQERAQMGARGRKLVIQEYSWDNAGMKSRIAYDWLDGILDNQPDFIH